MAKHRLNEERRFVPGYGWTPGPAPQVAVSQSRGAYWLLALLPMALASIFALQRR